jgi:manganese/zinc/iron transport system substrate-binding protein
MVFETIARRSLIALVSGVLLVAAAGVAGVAGCDSAGGSGGGSTGKLRVVATTTMIGDLVRRIGGDRIELKVIMGAGVDPHTFKPSPSDFAELVRAQLILYNGLHLEGKMVETFEQKLKDKSVAVADAVPKDTLLAWQEGQGGAHDPHIWFDTSLWAKAAEAVRDGLIAKDPSGADGYRQRAGDVVASLTALHDEVKQKIGSIPENRRVLITSHDAYNYFGKAYDIQVRGLQGISTETEAGIQAINGAVDFIISKKIPAIFVESSVSPKAIERVRDDCKARGFDVKIGGELFSDAMGSPGQHPGYAVETYEGMVRYNVDTIANALK